MCVLCVVGFPTVYLQLEILQLAKTWPQDQLLQRTLFCWSLLMKSDQIHFNPLITKPGQLGRFPKSKENGCKRYRKHEKCLTCLTCLKHFKALAVTAKHLMPWQHFQICSHSPGHLMLKIDLTGQWPYPIAGEESFSNLGTPISDGSPCHEIHSILKFWSYKNREVSLVQGKPQKSGWNFLQLTWK